MTRLIDKDDLISFLERVFPDNVIEGITSTTLFKQIIQDIRCQPIVMPEERPHGKWIEHQDCHDDTYYTCSHCGEDWTTIEGDPMDNLMNYCPMCGAEMRGGRQ